MTEICAASRLFIVCLAVGISTAITATVGHCADDSDQDLVLTGAAVQGGLIIGQTQPTATVKVDAEPIRVSEDGVFLVGFNRDQGPSVILEVTKKDGTKITHEFEVEARQYNVQRIEGVPQRTVTPPEDQLARIRKDTAQIVAARARDDARTDFLDGFIWPVVGTITGVYGSQRVYNGEPRRPHYGIDIAAAQGTPVIAPASGIISLAHHDMFYSGGTIILDHGHGLSSAFLHLSKVSVEVGQRVEQGDRIGEVGSTGRSTGPHLDWRINLFKQRLDAALVAPPMPAQ